MLARNTIMQELFTRDALLYSEILGILNRRADPFGNAWVEIVNGEKAAWGEEEPPLELRVHTRYSDDGGQAYDITQIVRLDCEYSPVQARPRHSPDDPGSAALQ